MLADINLITPIDDRKNKCSNLWARTIWGTLVGPQRKFLQCERQPHVFGGPQELKTNSKANTPVQRKLKGTGRLRESFTVSSNRAHSKIGRTRTGKNGPFRSH